MISIGAHLKPVIEMSNRLSGWLLLLAIIWLCWVAARLVWLVIAPPLAPALPLQALQNPATIGTDNSSLFTIFTEPDSVALTLQAPPNVVLKGVLLAIPEYLSSALLEVNGQVKNYRIGDYLNDNDYTLIAVDWNTVIIADAANKQTVLTMADSMALDQRDMAPDAISNQRLPDNNAATALSLPLSLPTDGINNLQANNTIDGADNGIQPQSAISEAIIELQQNPASYLSRMGVMASGDGYQVTATMPAAMRDRLGLEPGDKVLSVNGQNVGSNPAQDASVLQQVQQLGEAQIEVQRGEQIITIRQQF